MIVLLTLFVALTFVSPVPPPLESSHPCAFPPLQKGASGKMHRTIIEQKWSSTLEVFLGSIFLMRLQYSFRATIRGSFRGSFRGCMRQTELAVVLAIARPTRWLYFFSNRLTSRWVLVTNGGMGGRRPVSNLPAPTPQPPKNQQTPEYTVHTGLLGSPWRPGSPVRIRYSCRDRCCGAVSQRYYPLRETRQPRLSTPKHAKGHPATQWTCTPNGAQQLSGLGEILGMIRLILSYLVRVFFLNASVKQPKTQFCSVE